MKKICHLTSVHPRYDIRIYYKQCLSLVKNGFETNLIVADGQGDEILNGIGIFDVGKFNNRLLRFTKTTKCVLKKAIELDAQLYIVHDPELIPAALKLKKLNKRVIFDSHEDIPRQILEKDWIPKPFLKPLSTLVELYLKFSLKKLDAVLTVTHHFVENLKKASNEVYMITNYPLIENKPIEFSFEEYKNRKNTLCYAGSIYYFSLQENIIEAIRNQDDIEYIIVGRINDKYKNKLSKHLEQENVKLINWLTKSELAKIFSEATIGNTIFDYSPNLGYKKGNLGVNKIFEYMHSGLPIISTDFEHYKEIIDEYKCGLYVNPNNIEDIRAAIRFLIENKQEAYLMGQNGQRAVLEKFNWNSQEKKYLEIINHVLNK
jgi:glycosyltransferase involved in cell wall biosynthesis